MRPLLMLTLSLLASASLVAQSDGSTQQQASNPNATQPQTSEPSKSQSEHASTASAAPAQGDSTKVEAIKRALADYPTEAQREGTQGQVWVKFFITEAGDVDRVEFVSGDKIFERAALDAARKWKFKPFIKDGKPVKVVTTIPFDFAFGDKVTDTNPSANAATDNGGSTKPVQVSPGVSRGLLVHKVAPVYPESARQNHVQGTVVLRALIGKNGRIAELTPVSGPEELVPAAMGAVQQWRYKPYLLGGQPVTVATQIIVNFQLH